jgi:hypothetical protein
VPERRPGADASIRGAAGQLADGAPGAPITVGYRFDPICPWTWVTSRWLVEVASHRPVDIEWRVLSLAAINELEEEHPVWGPSRVAQVAWRAGGSDALGRFYNEVGRRIHLDQAPWTQATYADALEGAGLPGELAEAIRDRTLDGELRDACKEARVLVGADTGSPVWVVDGIGLNGPVLASTPRGEAAVQLFDHLRAVVSNPGGFCEIRRGRPGGPSL